MAAVCSRPLQLISLFLPSFFFSSFPPSLGGFFLFVSLPNQSFSFRPELILPSLIISEPSPATWSGPILLFFFSSISFFFICPALHFAAAAVNHLKWHSFTLVLLLGNLCRHAEQRLDWTRLASLSAHAESVPCIRCRRAGSVLLPRRCYECENRLPTHRDWHGIMQVHSIVFSFLYIIFKNPL